MYIAIHPSGFYVTFFHLHYCLWSIKIPQSAISVRRASICAYPEWHSPSLDHFPLTGGSGWLSLARLSDVYLGTALTLTFHNRILNEWCSIKLIGLFVTALVGLYTIEDLWNKFGDLRMPAVRPFPSFPD